tara:strand:+ start:92 stop:1447 length:1356 start_codon:yes stop_codon:yes gene_type:complete
MDNKEKYGEVLTPLDIIDEMYRNSEEYILSDLKKKSETTKINILDVGTGDGKFIKCFIEKYPIISKQCIFYGIEKNNFYETIFNENMKSLKNFVDYNINYINDDITKKITTLQDKKFDLIVGNPPFNNNGLIKVPCNKKIEKSKEGESIWYTCIQNSMELLNGGGYLLMVSPCLWLKPDKSNTYEILLNENELLMVKNYESYESHKLFKYKAQTPVNYFLSRKVKNKKSKYNETKLKIYSGTKSFDFVLNYNFPIPTHHIDQVIEAQELMKKYNIGNLSRMIVKSNPINEKKMGIQNDPHETNNYKNVKTCVKNKESKELEIIYNYSTEVCPYFQDSKIYCPHKRLPVFFKDYDGKYGISKRDTFIISEVILTELYSPTITPKNVHKYLELLYEYLNSEKIKMILQCTKYRMNFLEKYAYSYVPNIVEYVLKNKMFNEKNYIILHKFNITV